ncbi:MAG: shikimate dehydrogenase [Actinomycetota bacterium]
MLTSDIRRAAVLGSPIDHSLSPTLHEAAYRALGLSDWVYGIHEVRASELGGFVSLLGSEWAGLSLTMPLKEVAFEVADEVSDLAREVGAVNTLVRRPDGGWNGDNTDVYGVSQALREAGVGHIASAMVLGSGATARSVVAGLAALGCPKVTFAVRWEARLETLEQARRAGLEVEVVGLREIAGRVGDSQLVISTLPENALSASALVDLLFPQGLQMPDHLLLDVVYAGWPSPLARAFADAGARVVSGFEMLVHQAAEQVHLMTGLPAPVEQMRAAGLAAMSSR